MDSVHIQPLFKPMISQRPRGTYRHGDLRRALLDAGISIAAEGGPEAVTLREATRRAGVVPNAAYRHFASQQELLAAVRSRALSAVAVAMESELAAAPRKRRRADAARASLRAVGTGYLRFARDQTGLFRTAFAAPREAWQTRDPDRAGHSGLNPFELLGAALDQMTETGALDAARRPGAEYLAWSAVHGLAMLMIEGPLQGMDGAHVEKLGARVIEMVVKGIV